MEFGGGGCRSTRWRRGGLGGKRGEGGQGGPGGRPLGKLGVFAPLNVGLVEFDKLRQFVCGWQMPLFPSDTQPELGSQPEVL